MSADIKKEGLFGPEDVYKLKKGYLFFFLYFALGSLSHHQKLHTAWQKFKSKVNKWAQCLRVSSQLSTGDIKVKQQLTDTLRMVSAARQSGQN